MSCLIVVLPLIGGGAAQQRHLVLNCNDVSTCKAHVRLCLCVGLLQRMYHRSVLFGGCSGLHGLLHPADLIREVRPRLVFVSVSLFSLARLSLATLRCCSNVRRIFSASSICCWRKLSWSAIVVSISFDMF
eukprot:PhM_4_TR13087/c0_g1_i1/m.56740